MIWKIFFFFAALLTAAGIPTLFFHWCGWIMIAGGIIVASLIVDKAWMASVRDDVRSAARKLDDLGKFSPAMNPAAYFDAWQKNLEAFRFLYVADICPSSEKSKHIRLMCDAERKIWIVLRKSFGQIVVTFYSFGINGGAVAISNSMIPGIRVVGRALQEKHPRLDLSNLVKLVKDKVFDFECKFPPGLPIGVCSFDTHTDFLGKLDEFKIRRSLASASFDREALTAWNIPPEKQERLLFMRSVNSDEYWGYLPSLPTLRLQSASTPDVKSHLGGLPSLPPDMEWPQTPSGQAMNFIAQIDCAELPHTPGIPPLPENGLLLFFSAQEDECGYFGTKPDDACGWRVIFLEPSDMLKTHEAPAGLYVFKKMPVAAIPEKTTLGGHAYGEHDPAASYHLMFGYPDDIQSENMPEDCVAMTKTSFPSVAADWLLLLQVDTDHTNSNLQFGDMGTLYFWICKDDLAAKRFDRVWMLMECY